MLDKKFTLQIIHVILFRLPVNYKNFIFNSDIFSLPLNIIMTITLKFT